MKRLWFSLKMNSVISILAFICIIIIASICDALNFSLIESVVPVALYVCALLLIMYAVNGAQRHRLNEYFVASKALGSKYRNIHQLVNKQHTKNMDCAAIRKDIVYSSMRIFKNLASGYYRTITHTSICNIIQGKYKETIVVSLEAYPMKPAIKNLMQSRCKAECHHGCKSIKAKEDFYYIEFYVPEQTKNQN